MKHNVGGVDKIVRIVVGVALIGAAAVGVAPWWVGVIGVVPLGTRCWVFARLYADWRQYVPDDKQ